MSGPLGDRRARVRFEIVGALWGVLELTESVRLLNISNSGALIESPLAVPPESMHSVRMSIDDQPVTIDVRVRHSRSVISERGPRYLIGLEFVSPPPPLVHSIERLAAEERPGRLQ